jgi:hypothetical protein
MKLWSMCINCEANREGHHKDTHCGYPVEYQIGDRPRFDGDPYHQTVNCKGGVDCTCEKQK